MPDTPDTPNDSVQAVATKLQKLGATLNIDAATAGRAVLKYMQRTKISFNTLMQALEDESLRDALQLLLEEDRIEMVVDEQGKLKYQEKNP